MGKANQKTQGISATADAQDQPPINRRLLWLAAAAAAVGGYAWWDAKQQRERRAAEELALKAALQQRQVAEQAERKQRLQREAEERRAQADRRRVEEEQRRASLFPVEIRRERIQAQFSAWDGSHMATEAAIKSRMNNPSSYEHVQTVYVDRGPGRGLQVTTRFRGTNAFNAVVLNMAVAGVSESGVVQSLSLVR